MNYKEDEKISDYLEEFQLFREIDSEIRVELKEKIKVFDYYLTIDWDIYSVCPHCVESKHFFNSTNSGLYL